MLLCFQLHNYHSFLSHQHRLPFTMCSILRATPFVSAEEAALPGNGITSKEDAPRGASSKLFTPLTIGNGKLTLSHRVVLTPLTRNRGLPLIPNPTPETPNRIWYPDSLVTEYYVQRITPGGLLITEGLPPSVECNGMPGVPGLFCTEQVKGWRAVVDAVHAKGGDIYGQLWNAGRASILQHTGLPTNRTQPGGHQKANRRLRRRQTRNRRLWFRRHRATRRVS